MSFIQETIKCRDCGKEMNVATGTFGYGLPNECPKCSNSGKDWFAVISSGWNAQQYPSNPLL